MLFRSRSTPLARARRGPARFSRRGELGPARQRKQPAANEGLEIRAFAHVGADSFECSAYFAFAKSHARERPKGSRSDVRRRRRDCSPVDGAVGVAKAEASGRRALDEHLPAMDRPVVGPAGRDEIIGLMAAAVGARVDMVDIQKSPRAAAGEHAAPAVAAEHGAANGRRHVLGRAGCGCALGTLDVSDALRVALGGLDELGGDVDELAAPCDTDVSTKIDAGRSISSRRLRTMASVKVPPLAPGCVRPRRRRHAEVPQTRAPIEPACVGIRATPSGRKSANPAHTPHAGSRCRARTHTSLPSAPFSRIRRLYTTLARWSDSWTSTPLRASRRARAYRRRSS